MARAALNYSNFLLVLARSPEPTGVARELARRANATVAFVGDENAGLAADAAKDDAWDVAFIGAEPARAREIAFTPAYVEIEATYLVPACSPIQTLEDVDRDGVRIATAARAACTLYLQRTLRHATLGLGRERAAAAAYLTAFANEIRSSGLLGTLIERHGAHGLSVAAPPPR